MTQQLKQRATLPEVSLESTIADLARWASIEINVHDLRDVQASRKFLNPGQRIFVTFLPKQTWEETAAACCLLRDAGFSPVPHIPVRPLIDEQLFEELVAGLVREVGVEELLLLSGDYAQGLGPFSCVEDVLNTGVLTKCGLQRVSFAGHPEGHPKVPASEIRRAERAKALTAAESGLKVNFVTQFFFEADPFLAWEKQLRSAGVQARLVAGLAGPARISTLFKFAMRCGAGPSMRALGARPSAFTKLLGDHGPQNVLCNLAQAHVSGQSAFAGIHLFCFGGYLRTCEWLHRVANGEFHLNRTGGFNINQR
jgi:methylenetetrahydrofolate reductase (NADPH)